eukprot:Opistho-2@68626
MERVRRLRPSACLRVVLCSPADAASWSIGQDADLHAPYTLGANATLFSSPSFFFVAQILPPPRLRAMSRLHTAFVVLRGVVSSHMTLEDHIIYVCEVDRVFRSLFIPHFISKPFRGSSQPPVWFYSPCKYV